MDPYAVLGIARDATTRDIRGAYVRRSGQTHPDRGGEPEDFRTVKLAYDVLRNAAKREKYDRTGQIEDTVPDNADAAAANLITGLLGHILSEDIDPLRYDVIGAMRQIIDNKISEVERPLAKLRRAAERADKMRARFKALVDIKVNRMDAALAWHADRAREQITALEAQLAGLRHALGILGNYTFERDPDPTNEAWNMVRGLQSRGYCRTHTSAQRAPWTSS